MELLPKHQANISKFLKSIILGNRDSACSPPFLDVAVPREFLDDAGNNPCQRFMVIAGDQYTKFQNIIKEMSQDTNYECLKMREIMERVLYLACEVYFNKRKYDDRGKLKLRIEEFLNDIAKPIEPYEALFKIENMELAESMLEVRDFQIVKWSREGLIKWGVNKTDEKMLLYFSETPMMVIKEQGNSQRLIMNKAREQAEFNLKALEVYLSESRFLSDENLLFELSEWALLKNQATQVVNYNCSKKRSPHGLLLNKNMDSFITKSNDHYKTIERLSDNVKNAIKRALFWMGKSINEQLYDDKIISLCIAMETLLTTKDDKAKGEAITFRMIMLNRQFGHGFVDPSLVLEIYERRSCIVHGSAMFVTSQSEYFTLLDVMREVLDNFIRVTEKEGLQTISEVISFLENSKLRDEIIKWLEKRDDKHSHAILEHIKRSKNN